MSWFDNNTINILAQLVARNATQVIEIGREFGFRYPAKYDVGFTLVEDIAIDGLCRCMVRVDDHRYRFQTRYSVVDGGEKFMHTLWNGSAICVHQWTDVHPEYKPTAQVAKAAAAQLQREAKAVGEKAYLDRIADIAKKRTQEARFEFGHIPQRGPGLRGPR